jgi:hypothetical protein
MECLALIWVRQERQYLDDLQDAAGPCECQMTGFRSAGLGEWRCMWQGSNSQPWTKSRGMLFTFPLFLVHKANGDISEAINIDSRLEMGPGEETVQP